MTASYWQWSSGRYCRISCVYVGLRGRTSSTCPDLSSWSAPTLSARSTCLCTLTASKSGRILFSAAWINPRKAKKSCATGLRSRNCRTCGSSSKAIIWFLRPVPANVVREQSGNISTGCHLNPTAQVNAGYTYSCVSLSNIVPSGPNSDSEKQKRRRKKSNKNSKPALTIGLPTFVNGLQVKCKLDHNETTTILPCRW